MSLGLGLLFSNNLITVPITNSAVRQGVVWSTTLSLKGMVFPDISLWCTCSHVSFGQDIQPIKECSPLLTPYLFTPSFLYTCLPVIAVSHVNSNIWYSYDNVMYVSHNKLLNELPVSINHIFIKIWYTHDTFDIFIK